MVTLFLVVLILVILAIPIWPHSQKWSGIPAGILALLAIILLFTIFKSIEVKNVKGKTIIELDRRYKN